MLHIGDVYLTKDSVYFFKINKSKESFIGTLSSLGNSRLATKLKLRSDSKIKLTQLKIDWCLKENIRLSSLIDVPEPFVDLILCGIEVYLTSFFTSKKRKQEYFDSYINKTYEFIFKDKKLMDCIIKEVKEI